MCRNCEREANISPFERAKCELVEERRKNDALTQSVKALEKINQLQTNQLMVQRGQQDTVGDAGICLFQKMLPLEIRIRVYSFLLVNPQLADKRRIGANTEYGAKFKYGLSPNILRACRWMHEETLAVLYGANKFILLPQRRAPGLMSSLPQSPLTRYMDQRLYTGECPFSFDEIPMFGVVRKWLVLVQSFPEKGTQSEEFFRFCHSLASRPPLQKLEVLVMMVEKPMSPAPQSQKSPTHWILWMKQIERVGNTLGMLRNVGMCSIRSARKKDLTPCMISQYNPWFPDRKLYACYDEGGSYKRCVEGNTPVERVFEMQSRLLTYVQTFERDPLFKAEMDPNRQIRKANISQAYFTASLNPFTSGGELHYVEKCLRRTHQESKGQNSHQFRIHRKDILLYLEAQYERIADAHILLKEFVKKHKTEGGLLDEMMANEATPEWCGFVFEEALMTVEKCAKSFDRDLDVETSRKVRVRYNGRITNDNLPREKAIARMNLIQRTEDDVDCYLDEFLACFRLAVNDMVEQFFEIRKARKALFDFDMLVDTPPPIDVHDNRVDSPIDWTLYSRRNQNEASNLEHAWRHLY